MNQAELMDDMHDLLARRVHSVIGDVADTCVRASVSQDDTLKLVVSALLYEVTAASVVLGTNEEQFLSVCRLAWRTLSPEFVKRYEGDSK